MDPMRSAVACARCGSTLFGSTLSRFNTQNLCRLCAADEREAPGYAAAEAAEIAAVRSGQFGFVGVGLSAADQAFLLARRAARREAAFALTPADCRRLAIQAAELYRLSRCLAACAAIAAGDAPPTGAIDSRGAAIEAVYRWIEDLKTLVTRVVAGVPVEVPASPEAAR